MKVSFQTALQEIKNRIDILSGIAKYLPIKKSGSSYIAVCPFHADKSPSLHIAVSKGIYKCFACGASGDLFRFIMDYKKMSFAEVVSELAEECGLEIIKKEISPELSEEQDWIFKLNDLANKYFQDHLKGVAEDYLLNERQLPSEIIQNFSLGYTANNRDSLLQFIKTEMKPPAEILLKSGLFMKDTHSENLIDRFRQRLIIPIKDSQGRIVAFGGRTLDANIQPKYLNSPETAIYTKGQHLFAWNIAQNQTKQKKQILLLEGYFDVIQAHAKGFDYAVGSLGTALTKEQASILYGSNLGRRIILGFDNDTAGFKALIGAIKVFQESQFSHKPDLRALNLGECKDIDEYLLKYPIEAMEALLKDPPKAYSFVLEERSKQIDLNDSEKRAELLREFAELLKGEKDPIEKEIWAEACARNLSFSKNTVLNLLQTPTKWQNTNNYQNKKFTHNFKNTSTTKAKPSPNAEKTLVSLLFYPLTEEYINKIQIAFLSNEPLQELKEQLIKMPAERRQNFIENNNEELLAIAQWHENKDLNLVIEECLNKIIDSKKFQNAKKLYSRRHNPQK